VSSSGSGWLKLKNDKIPGKFRMEPLDLALEGFHQVKVTATLDDMKKNTAFNADVLINTKLVSNWIVELVNPCRTTIITN